MGDRRLCDREAPAILRHCRGRALCTPTRLDLIGGAALPRAIALVCRLLAQQQQADDSARLRSLCPVCTRPGTAATGSVPRRQAREANPLHRAPLASASSDNSLGSLGDALMRPQPGGWVNSLRTRHRNAPPSSPVQRDLLEGICCDDSSLIRDTGRSLPSAVRSSASSIRSCDQ